MAHGSCSWSDLKKAVILTAYPEPCSAKRFGLESYSGLLLLAVGRFKPVTMPTYSILWPFSGVDLVRLPLAVSLLLLVQCFGFAAHLHAAQQVDIYRSQALVKSQSESERNAAAHATFGELIVRVSGQRNALDNPVIRAAVPNAQNYLFGFSYKSSNEKLIEGARSFTALALQLDYEPQAISKLLKEAQLPIWPAQRPKLLVWLVSKDQRGLSLVPEVIDMQALNGAASYRGLPLVFPKLDQTEEMLLSAGDLWDLNLEKIKAASIRYKADAILIGRYTPSSMGPIPPAVVLDSLATEIAVPDIDAPGVPQENTSAATELPVEPSQGPWLAEWLLIHGDNQTTQKDETPEVKGLFSNAIEQAADYFAEQYAIMPSSQGAQPIVLRIGNIKSFAAFKQVQAYLEGLAMVQRMEVVSVTAEAVVVRLTTEADVRLLINTLALGRRLSLVSENVTSLVQQVSAGSEASLIEGEAPLPEGIDAEAMADLERALASEQMANGGATDVAAGGQSNYSGVMAVIPAGSLQDPLVYVWQK